MTPDGGPSDEEQPHQRGLALQATIPEPTGWGARLAAKRRRSSETSELGGGIVDLALSGGIWALLLAIPGVIIWVIRRLRRKPV